MPDQDKCLLCGEPHRPGRPERTYTSLDQANTRIKQLDRQLWLANARVEKLELTGGRLLADLQKLFAKEG